MINAFWFRTHGSTAERTVQGLLPTEVSKQIVKQQLTGELALLLDYESIWPNFIFLLTFLPWGCPFFFVMKYGNFFELACAVLQLIVVLCWHDTTSRSNPVQSALSPTEANPSHNPANNSSPSAHFTSAYLIPSPDSSARYLMLAQTHPTFRFLSSHHVFLLFFSPPC